MHFSLTFMLAFALAGSIRPLPKLRVDSFAPTIRAQIREAYENALRTPEKSDNNGRLGMFLHAYDQLELAEICFERARAFDPNHKRWAYYLGKTQAALGKHDSAALFLQEALRQNPGYLPAQLTLGESLLSATKLEESQKVFEAVIQQHPDAAAAYYGLGRIRVARREFTQAVELFRKACELYPSFGAAHYALALAYRDLGETQKAQEHLERYQKNKLAWPSTPDPLLWAIEELKSGAGAHLKKGVRLEADGRMEEAVEEHEQALKVDPKFVQARINLITLYGKMGQVEKAEQQYQAAVAINPNLAEAHYNYGVLLTRLKRDAQAAEAFRRALEISPNYAEANNNYAYLLMTTGRLDEAAQHYRIAIQNKPNYKLAHFNLGRILVHQEKVQDAINHFLQTLTPEDESTPSYLYALGAAYARLGNRESALKYLRDARQKAGALGQSEVLSSIEKDILILERRPR